MVAQAAMAVPEAKAAAFTARRTFTPSLVLSMPIWRARGGTVVREVRADRTTLLPEAREAMEATVAKAVAPEG
jgi:hypothetical protein